MSIQQLDAYPDWASLEALAHRLTRVSLTDLMGDSSRCNSMVGEVAGLHVDWSRQLVTDEVIKELHALAAWRELPRQVASMMQGDRINATENRSVLHTALRAPKGEVIKVDGHDVVPGVHDVLDQMAQFADSVRSGSIRSSSGALFTDVVNIGIGGSDLGPAMAVEALSAYGHERLTFHFVSNVDPSDVHRVMSRCNPETTLVLIASKTFTTAETMANATAARAWLVVALGEDAVTSHLAAMSTAIAATAAFGVDPARVFGFWDWVGGRYSVGSAIGLSLMLAIGSEQFRKFLAGMHEVDVHFRETPVADNIPMLIGLLAVWNRCLLDIPTNAFLPYEQLLSRFPAYLQQLMMESNGKRVMLDGQPVAMSTGAVIWGEPGTNGQHSFHQLLHQGSGPVACDLVAFANSSYPIGDQHDMLLANALAQAEVLATGRSEESLRAAGIAENLIAHKAMSGGRPTTLIIGEALTPHALGALIALYEHSVFTQGALWGINSFDQWGVEYGKEVATSLLPMVAGASDTPAPNPSTAASIALLRRLRR